MIRTLCLSTFLAALSAALPSLASACPFCDFGANQTAKLILIVFGFLAIGGGLIFFAYVRSGGLKASEGVGNIVLEAETRSDSEGVQNDK